MFIPRRLAAELETRRRSIFNSASSPAHPQRLDGPARQREEPWTRLEEEKEKRNRPPSCDVEELQQGVEANSTSGELRFFFFLPLHGFNLSF